MWGNHHQDARTAPRAQQPPQNGQPNYAMQGLGKRPRPAGHNEEEEEAMRMMNAAGSWNQMMKMRGALTAPQQQAYADGQQQVSFPINPAMMQAQQMQGPPHPAMLQKYQQLLFRQQQLQAEQAKGPDSNYSAMPPQARPDASTLTRMSDSEAMYSHAPQQQGAGFPNMAWGHEMQNSNPALHASSSSFGSMGKDAASRHNDSDDGSWDGNNNDRNGPSDAQLSYLKEKESSGQALTAEEKLFLTRERNRDHSRKSRLRKKVYVEGLKATISDLSAYRMLVEMCGDLISVHAADDKMTVVFASAGFQRVLGFETERLLGKDFVALINPEDHLRVRQAMQNALVYGDMAQVRFRILGADNVWRDAEASFRLHQLRQIIAITRVSTTPASTSETESNQSKTTGQGDADVSVDSSSPTAALPSGTTQPADRP